MKDNRTKVIEKILNELGINIANKGYRYWITAINYYIENDMNCNMEEVYTEVAMRHKTTKIRAERALRYECTNNRKRIEEYFEAKYTVTNKVFLRWMSEIVVNCETGEFVENDSKELKQ